MIIDGHHHILDDHEGILARMDALGIDRTVLVGVGVRDLGRVTLGDSWVFRVPLLMGTLGTLRARAMVRSRAFQENLLGEPRNDAVLRAVRARPDRFDGFAFINPGSPASMASAEPLLAAGLKGLKLALVQYPTDLRGPRMAELCELARARRAPLFIHIGLDRASSDLPAVARAFPDVTFIAAHAGCQRFREVLALARTCPNVLVDTSSHLATPARLRRLHRVLGAGRLVFGSDRPVMCGDVADALGKVLGLRLPSEDQARILGGNLEAVLREVRRDPQP